MPHIRPKNGKEPPQLPFVAQTFQFVSLVFHDGTAIAILLPFVAQTFQFVSLVFHGGTVIAILLPFVAQTFQFVSVDAKTKSLRYGTFAAHQRFSLKNGVRTSEVVSVATCVIL